MEGIALDKLDFLIRDSLLQAVSIDECILYSVTLGDNGNNT